MKTRKRIKQVFICLLALMFLIPLARQADALNYDGSGTSGGGVGSTNSSNYTVAHTNTYSVIGYRFTGVLATDGSRPKNTPSIDICHKSAVNEGGYDKFSRCRPQFSKVEYAQGRRNGTPKIWTETTNNWTKGALREGIDINFDTALPVSSDAGQYATLMGTWQENEKNINAIAKLVGYENGINSMGKNDMIIVEPLFCVQIAGDFMAMTVSEMAQVGGESYNYDSNGWSYTGAGNYGSLGENTWGFISNFTNRKWPNVLYALLIAQNGSTASRFVRSAVLPFLYFTRSTNFTPVTQKS